MRYLKLYEDLLSEEDISDYLLQFMDNKDLEFVKHEMKRNYATNEYYVRFDYKLSDKFCDISNSDDMIYFSNLLSEIGSVCKRWKLDFNFGINANFRYELSIYQQFPEIVTKFLNENELSHFQTYNLRRIAPNTAKYLAEFSEVGTHFTLGLDKDLNFLIKVQFYGDGKKMKKLPDQEGTIKSMVEEVSKFIPVTLMDVKETKTTGSKFELTINLKIKI